MRLKRRDGGGEDGERFYYSDKIQCIRHGYFKVKVKVLDHQGACQLEIIHYLQACKLPTVSTVQYVARQRNWSAHCILHTTVGMCCRWSVYLGIDLCVFVIHRDCLLEQFP